MMLVIKRDEIIKICEKMQKEYSMKFNRCADIIEREPNKARSLTLVAMDMMDDIISQITFVRTALINEAERRAKEEVEKPSSDDDFEARDLLQDILEEEKLERHIEEMLMDAIEEGADNA